MKNLIVWGMKSDKNTLKRKFATNAAYAISNNWNEFASLPCDATYMPQSLLYKLIGPERIGKGGLIEIEYDMRVMHGLPPFVITGNQFSGRQAEEFESMSSSSQCQFFATDLFNSLRVLSLGKNIVFNVWGQFVSPIIDYFDLIHNLNSLVFDAENNDRKMIMQSLRDDAFEKTKAFELFFYAGPKNSFAGTDLYHSRDIDIRGIHFEAFLRSQRSI